MLIFHTHEDFKRIYKTLVLLACLNKSFSVRPRDMFSEIVMQWDCGHFDRVSLYKDASVTKNLPSKMCKFFFCFFELSGPKESRWDTFELTQTLQRVLGSHFKFGGKFKFFRLLHKTQQYGCLWTPMKSLPTISLTKAFLVAQICPNLHA